MAIGCSRASIKKIIPEVKIVRNGDYELHVKEWTNGESMVALTYAGRTVYYGNAYDSNKFDGTLCVSTSAYTDIFYKDDYRYIGHGSLMLNCLDKSSGSPVTFIDWEVDGT